MTLSQSNEAIEVFFSYSHRDEDFRDELIKHLGLLQRQGVIRAWHDRKIDAGTEWKQDIDIHLQTASIILLLISADFLASDYCYDLEMKRAMARHEVGEARVIPVILRAVDWHSAPFGKLQALPVDGRPVTSWSNRDEAFMQIAKAIRAVAEKFTAKSSPSAVVESITDVSIKKMEVEITIDRDFASYSEADQEQFLRAVREFLKMSGDLKIKRKRPGSVKITVELSPEQARELLRAIKAGQFKQYGVVEAELRGVKINLKYSEIYTEIHNKYKSASEEILSALKDDQLAHDIVQLILNDDISSPTHISRLLGISVKAVYNTRTRIKRKLEEYILSREKQD